MFENDEITNFLNSRIQPKVEHQYHSKLRPNQGKELVMELGFGLTYKFFNQNKGIDIWYEIYERWVIIYINLDSIKSSPKCQFFRIKKISPYIFFRKTTYSLRETWKKPREKNIWKNNIKLMSRLWENIPKISLEGYFIF